MKPGEKGSFSWLLKVVAKAVYIIGAIFGSLAMLFPNNLADGAKPAIIVTVVASACVGTALIIKAKSIEKQWIVSQNITEPNRNTEIARQHANKKLNGILVCTTAIIIIATLFTVYGSSVPKHKMKNICEEYGLKNIEISLTRYHKSRSYTSYKTTIHCDGFSSLDLESCSSFFHDISSVRDDGKKFYRDNLTVCSDGKIYTSKLEKINGTNMWVDYVDGKSVNEQYDESNKVSCPNCGGRGSIICNNCNGKGKHPVTFYSEGDWGYKTYATYDCGKCDGKGRYECTRCYGDGYYYNIGE